ncbi:MAG: hypothetical protein ACLFNS_10940 [Desulfobacterales bacterium]
MRIAFLHYHLKPGGVTRVIQQQIDVLAGQAEMLMLTGTAPQTPVPAETRVISGLDYDQTGKASEKSPESATDIADQIIRAIHDKWPDGCDLIHVHNPLLAKNRKLPEILSYLQRQGNRLLIQVHDFAEDGRPAAYYTGVPYPENCHYCVINSRDYDILCRSGLNTDGLHLLPNMVDPFHLSPQKTIEERFVLYPVRGIRRKNIGEAMLAGLFFAPRVHLAITLPPNSPRDWAPYLRWQAFAEKHQLPVIFEASQKYEFSDLIQSAESMITTSITEGFGFAFLEPWTAGQHLCGRKLPDICRDFEKNGLNLDHLYEQLAVPLKAFDAERFFDHWKTCIKLNADRYSLKLKEETIQAGFDRITRNQSIDFGMLDEGFQEQVILEALSNGSVYQEILAANPLLYNLTTVPDRTDRISKNRAAVLNNYNADKYQEQLVEIYQEVKHSDVRQAIDKSRLAYEFLRPETFSLLKWSEHAL